MTELKAGLKLNSAVCDAQIMVIKPGANAALTCGGVPMLAGDETPGDAAPDAEHMAGCQIGKRYVNEDQSIEVLCVKAGAGSLAADGTALTTKEAKKLPSSD
jgi:hypothetical protein